MRYKQHLPPVRFLLSLAKNTRFPASREEIARNAYDWGFTNTTINFLNLFPSIKVFKSRVNFMTRCEELEMLINEQRRAPREILHSPQD